MREPDSTAAHGCSGSIRVSQYGFTLIELLTSMSVLAVLLAFGVPAMSEFIANQRTTGAANRLLADLALARTQALVIQRPVRVSAAGPNWEDGWTVFSDANANGVVDGVGIGADEQYVQGEALPDGFALSMVDDGGTVRTDLWFNSLGAGVLELSGNVSITYPLRFVVDRPDRDPDKASTICIAASGVALVRKGTALC